MLSNSRVRSFNAIRTARDRLESEKDFEDTFANIIRTS